MPPLKKWETSVFLNKITAFVQALLYFLNFPFILKFTVMIIFAVAILSMYITIVLIPYINKVSFKYNLLDTPNERKVHQFPKPRSGGIAMAFGIFIPLIFWAPIDQFLVSLLLSASIIVFFGLIDDFNGIGYKLKFASQIAASLVIIYFGDIQIRDIGSFLSKTLILHDFISIPLTIFVIVGVTNAINLSDGLDGLAGGISLLSFICIGYLGFCYNNTLITICSVAVIGSIFGFLRFNSYPSILFMGDTGSQLLGFFSIVLSINLTQTVSTLSPLLPVFIIGFPIIDTITVLSSRIATGSSPFKADNRHFHHKLIQLGLYHSEAVLFIYFLQSFYVLSPVIFYSKDEIFLAKYYIISSIIILLFFYFAHIFRWKISRKSFFDTIIKGRLRKYKDKSLFIKFLFVGLKYIFHILLLLSCFIPGKLPFYFTITSIIIFSVFLVAWKLNTNWTISFSGIIFYLTIPAIIYMGESNPGSWVNHNVNYFHLSLFIFLMLFSYLTLKFTRRQSGFKTTPLDFLIVFIVLTIPYLPDPRIHNLNIGFTAIKIIVLYIGYEVYTGEMRNKSKNIVKTSIFILSIVCARGIFSFINAL